LPRKTQGLRHATLKEDAAPENFVATPRCMDKERYMNAVVVTLERALVGLPPFAIALALFVAGKYFYRWTSKFDFDDELTGKHNPAFGVTLGGYLLGLVIALAGTLGDAGADIVDSSLSVLVFGAVSIVLLRLSLWVNDKFILYSFSNTYEIIQRRSLGTGFVVAGSAIATGLIISGVLHGPSTGLLLPLRDIVVYWAVGQVALIVGGLIFQKSAGYDVLKAIEVDDNMAAGLSFSGFLAAIGVVIGAAVYGASSELLDEVLTTVTATAIGLVLLTLSKVIIDHAFLPKGHMGKEISRDKNPAAGAVSAICFVAVALLLGTTIMLPPAPRVPATVAADASPSSATPEIVAPRAAGSSAPTPSAWATPPTFPMVVPGDSPTVTPARTGADAAATASGTN
jgi:uncharacterized membrane protein YjfL (UPF0719 family)